MKIVVTGSIAYDYLMSYPGRFSEALMAQHLESVSLSFLVDSLKRQRGGTAPNIAYSMALLGGNPTVLATAGQDFAEYRAWLEQHGVNTSGVITIKDEYCASFFVSTDLDMNQIASFYTGAMAHSRILTFAEHAPNPDLTIISPNDPDAMLNHAEECRQSGIRFIYDPSQQTARLNGQQLKAGLVGSYMLSVNEYEFELIQEKTGMTAADIETAVEVLLVTHGKNGATIRTKEAEYKIPIVPPKEIVEPTGAGDAYRAGLMRGMQLGLDWEIAGRMGAVTAAYVLEQVGTMNHQFTPAEFVARYRAHFDDGGALDALL